MKLLKSFRQFDKSILFGTNSFWEGVDVPGEALSAVIIVRLPFSSPDEVVFKARAARLASSGSNPFTEFVFAGSDFEIPTRIRPIDPFVRR